MAARWKLRLQQQVLKATGGSDAWSVRLNQGASPRCLALRVAGAAGPLQLNCDAGAAPGLLALQLVLVLEEGASLELLIQHGSSGPNATSLVAVAQLGRGAQLNLGLLAPGDARACLLSRPHTYTHLFCCMSVDSPSSCLLRAQPQQAAEAMVGTRWEDGLGAPGGAREARGGILSAWVSAERDVSWARANRARMSAEGGVNGSRDVCELQASVS